MSKIGQLRPYSVGLLVGATITGAVALWGTRQEAIAVPSSNSPALTAPANELSTAFRHVAAQTMPSIVSIETLTKAQEVVGEVGNPLFDENSPFREFFRNDPRFREFQQQPRRRMNPQRRGSGSGFVIDKSGVIMTNNHVVKGADEVRVRLHDGREFLATDIRTDPRTDVAVIHIQGAGDLKPLKLGDSRAMQVGDWVLAFGSPFGLEMTVTQGIISGTNRSRHLADREDFLQTDAAVNPGNSGGPLVNLNGEVVGINTAIASASGGYDGISFAIPTHIAGWVSEQLLAKGHVQRGYLGTSIAPVDAETAKQFNVNIRKGAVVKNIMPDSPADKAGLEPGDVVVKLNDQSVSDPSSLQGIVERLSIGKAYPLEVIRDGKAKTLQVTIEQMPDSFTAKSEASPSKTPTESFDKLGLHLSGLTPDLAKQLGLSNVKGVVVTGVEDGSVADEAGVASGDIVERVGNTPVDTPEAFKKAVDALNLKDGIVLHLRNAEGRRYVILKAGE